MVLRKIKQLLGMGSEESSGRSDQDVVVQQESAEPDTETEAAVKGTDDADDTDETTETNETAEDAAEEESDVEEPVAAATDADASTESLVDEEETQEHPGSRAEPAEAAGPGSKEESIDVEDAEPEVDVPDAEQTVEDAVAEEPEDDEEPEAGTPVDTVKGIGPAYSDRLAEVGIHSVEELAAADPEELAERVTVAEKTVTKWVNRAKEQTE